MDDMNLKDFYNRMITVNRLKFDSRSIGKSSMEWNYSGTGDVQVLIDRDEVYFSDSIYLSEEKAPEILNDRKMWKFTDHGIDFYHFRNGSYEKIFQFIFREKRFILSENYICEPDCYSGELSFSDEELYFTLYIVGKRKNEEIRYIYSTL